MLSLAIFTLPFSSLAISSRAGAICRHGPHHSAQKSTTTGVVDFSTSVSKVSSETFSVAICFSSIAGRRERLAWSDREPRYGSRGRQGLDVWAEQALFGTIKRS